MTASRARPKPSARAKAAPQTSIAPVSAAPMRATAVSVRRKPRLGVKRVKRIPMRLPIQIDTEVSVRFHSLPLSEKNRRLSEFQAFIEKALGSTTFDDYLDERRREARRDF